MKKIEKLCFIATAFIALGGFISCKSTEVENSFVDKSQVDKVTVVDWSNRTLGEESNPKWLKDLVNGNADAFKKEFGKDSSRIYKYSSAMGDTESIAQTLCRVGFAYSQAGELSKKIIGREGQSLSDGQLEAVNTVATETKVEMSGLREEISFWQKVRTINAITNEVSEDYRYYIVYSMDEKSWENLCRKYLMDIISDADLETETQKKIGALFSEMKADADKKDLKQAEEEERLYQIQMERLNAIKSKQNTTQSSNLSAEDSKIKAAVDKAIQLESFLK